MSKREGEVREIPFVKNDMKNQAPATGKPVDKTDAPGKADSEFADESNGNKTVDVDDAQLDDTSENKK